MTIAAMLYSGVVRSSRDAAQRVCRFSDDVLPRPASLDSATPAMRQYLDVKRQHRDAIVFFRMGDFYEMFYEDALDGVARARADADVAREGRVGRRRSRCAACRFTRSTPTWRGSSARAIASPSAIRSRIRARPRASSSAKSRASSRPARSRTRRYLDAREPAFLAAVVARRRRTAPGASRFSTSPRASSRRRSSPGADARASARRRAGRAAAEGTAGRRRRRRSTRALPTLAPAARDARRRRGRSSRRAPASALCEQLRHGVARRARPRAAPRPRLGRRRDRRPTCATRSARELAHVRDISLPRRRRRAADRSGHAAPPERRRGRRTAGAPARCSTTIDRTVTRDGRPAAAAVADASARRAGADSGSARRRRGLRVSRRPNAASCASC